jgi:hypothetical protein
MLPRVIRTSPFPPPHRPDPRQHAAGSPLGGLRLLRRPDLIQRGLQHAQPVGEGIGAGLLRSRPVALRCEVGLQRGNGGRIGLGALTRRRNCCFKGSDCTRQIGRTDCRTVRMGFDGIGRDKQCWVCPIYPCAKYGMDGRRPEWLRIGQQKAAHGEPGRQAGDSQCWQSSAIRLPRQLPEPRHRRCALPATLSLSACRSFARGLGTEGPR